MTRNILEVIFTMIPYVAIGVIALVAGHNHGYTKGYIHALEDVTRLKNKEEGSIIKLPKVVTIEKAAGVSPEVAPVQQEVNVWENPTHRGKK